MQEVFLEQCISVLFIIYMFRLIQINGSSGLQTQILHTCSELDLKGHTQVSPLWRCCAARVLWYKILTGVSWFIGELVVTKGTLVVTEATWIK